MGTRLRNLLLSIVGVAVLLVAGALIDGNGAALAALTCTGTNWDNLPPICQ